MMIEQLVSKVFADRNAAHIAHWAATGAGSYAKHVALDGFYSALPDAIDKIVETYQGAFSLLGPIPPNDQEFTDIIDRLEDSVAWIEMNRDRIAKRNSSLGNLLDSLMEVYFTTIYKLRTLS